MLGESRPRWLDPPSSVGVFQIYVDNTWRYKPACPEVPSWNSFQLPLETKYTNYTITNKEVYESVIGKDDGMLIIHLKQASDSS